MEKKKKKKVLIVEDDLAITDIYTTMLKRAGFEVEVANLGEEALRKFKEKKAESRLPDIVLLDLILPDISGAQVLEAIKGNVATKGTKVFVLTNQDASEAKFSAQATPDKYIIKANITPTQLLAYIQEQLGL